MHTQKVHYNQNKNCLSLCLKWFRGAESTSNGIEFQKNTELTKNE